ncbi:MAG: PKD domain-containing protein, partial [Planctomycetota bacterium]
MRKGKRARTTLLGLFAVSLTGAVLTGCTTLGGALIALPFAQITSIQVFDQPNYTVTFSIQSAVSNPALVSKINWVFGDGTGFVEGPAGRTTITHQYDATGVYAINAYVFDQTGTYVFRLDGSTTVVPNGGPGPGPDPTPEGFPGKVTGPNPMDEAENVDVTTTLTWTSGE